MATAAKKDAAPAAKKGSLAYPKNCPATGYLSFPLWNEEDINRLAQWRTEKGHAAGQFPDKIGGALFITQAMLDKIQAYILETFLPFTVEQYAHTDGKKGFDQATADELKVLVENEDWSETNLPIRDLSKKDLDSLGDDTEYVAKLMFSGSGGNEIQKKALGRDGDNDLVVIDIDDVSEAADTDRLWWGSRNIFRGAFNFNAYTRVVQVKKTTENLPGISAYARALYLRSDLPMNWGGNDDEVVLEDDFED